MNQFNGDLYPGLITVPIPAEAFLEDERGSFNDAYLFFQEGVFVCQIALGSAETSRQSG
jgi:hypothetical protein